MHRRPSADLDLQSFGAQLAHMRRSAGLSQLQLALEVNASSRHIGFLETGRSRPSAQMIARLADALRLSSSLRRQLFLAAGLLPIDTAPYAAGVRRSAMSLSAMDAAAALYRSYDAHSAAIAGQRLQYMGVRNFATATLWHNGRAFELDGDPDGHPPAAWLDRYTEQDYAQHDPVIAWNVQGRGAIHSHRFETDTLDRDQRRMFGEAAEHGLRACITVPTRRMDGRVRAFCGWVEDVDMRDHETIAAIRVVAAAWLEASALGQVL